MTRLTLDGMHPKCLEIIRLQQSRPGGEESNIAHQFECGCEFMLSGFVWPCAYHEGFNDGLLEGNE